MPLCCKICGNKAILKRPKTGDALCKECFYVVFETEVHHTIISNKLFTKGQVVAIGASGGKDSTVLAYVLKKLNEEYDYGLKLILLSVDEGITGYRDDSLETVKRNEMQYELPLKIVSYEELYGWTMDAIVKQIGLKNNCKCRIQFPFIISKIDLKGDALCKECFYVVFETEVHHTIISNKLFTKGQVVAIGASGGKDSTVLAYVLKKLNEEYDYGLKLILLSVDEGITGYRDDSLETVKRNEMQYELPLKIVSYEELYGWTMDAIVKQIGLKNNSFPGHNADDIAETVLMNVLRGDIARLRRCTAIVTGTEGAIPRCKPFKYTYEKEIVMYAYFKKLDYFSTECIYSPNAYRGHARTFLKDLEKIRPSSILDIIHSGESLFVKKDVKMPVQGICKRCGYISSQSLCKACVLLEGLNKGLPRLGIGKTTKAQIEALSSADGSSPPASRDNCSAATSLEF
ncbi:cytoplasmic tRNA 2-thiolation protein 1-like [Orbicella faveolata]|uniref:cytoplasmic tRNA 2-thiolation protein 1-like n=1 Tax=Orbicella faveolata TaxID=48498 RepID=UPI0009E43134|nr:cytoplasmic tRNA 2-thiolation protein 1-like [Orbicella faveolata]